VPEQAAAPETPESVEVSPPVEPQPDADAAVTETPEEATAQ
jgi:hypothetical protein